MNYKQTTQVPNRLFDYHLPLLSFSELKILLVIIRQTHGWIDRYTGKRKSKAKLSYAQFMRKTGISRRNISSAIGSLVKKNIILIMDFRGSVLSTPKERKGKRYLYYSSNLTPMAILGNRNNILTLQSNVRKYLPTLS